jgi:phage gp36-like protein
MSYATLTDLQKVIDYAVLVDLTDDAGSGEIDTAKTDQALAAADVEIDAYLARDERYSLPLNPAPSIVTKLAADIAIYNLYARRSGPPEHWQKRYDNAIKMLERIGKGELSLGANAPEQQPSDTAAVAATTTVFSSETLKNF